jgi:hypothetical protein
MSYREQDRWNSYTRVAEPPSSARPFDYDDVREQELVIRHKDTKEKEWDNGDFESRRDYYSDQYDARGPIYVSNHDEPDYHVVRRPDRDARDVRDVRERDVEIRYHHEVEDDLTDSHPTRSRRGRDHGDREYSSDDSLVYIRKETRENDENPAHHGRHLVEGAALGVGAAELFRRRNKSQGEASSGWGRVGRDVGAGALGAVAAEGLMRARSQHRSKSRRRSDLLEPDRGSHHRHHSSHRSRHRDSRHRHRSSSASKSGGVNMKQIAGLGLGAAALAAGVALARKKSSDRRERRSRSRHRRSSPSFSDVTATTATTNNGNSSHRNKRMVEAGLAGATVAGLIERARSKSRTRKGERARSQNRLKQALPILALGATSAAAVGLYEKTKAKNSEEEEVKSTRSRSRSRRRSRSRSAMHDPAGLIEYGQDPVYGTQTDYYGRSTSAQGYHSDEMVRTSRRHRSRSRSAAVFDSASDDSDRTDRRRHRHRELAEAAVVSGGLGYAAGKHVERNEKNRERQSKDRRNHDDRDLDRGHDPYEELYDPIYTPSPPPTGRSDQFYPNTMNFPPPPGSGPAGPPHMTDYPPPPGAPPPPRSYPYPPPPLGSPGNDPYESLPRRGDENV